MSTILTDEASDGAKTFAQFVIFALWIFTGYALSRHVPWEDALASTFVAMQTLRAISRRALPNGGPANGQ